MAGEIVKFEVSNDGIDPVNYIKDYFTLLSEKEIYVLVGSIALLEEVEIPLLQSVLDLEQIQVEEKIGRLMQTDLLDGHFEGSKFVLEKFNHKILKQNINLTLDDRAFLSYLKARFEIEISELERAFELSYASTVFLLSGFIAKGLISAQKLEDNKFRFIIHFNYPKRSPDNITKFEKELVGFFKLMKKTTIQEVSEILEEPEHKVLSTLANLILSDMIIAQFKAESGLFGKFVLYVIVDRFQVYFEPLSIQVMSNNERNFIGYLSLRKSANVNEIAETLEKSTVEILKIGSSLLATNQLEISLQDNIFTIEKERPLASNKDLDTLSKIHSFNYRIMIGLIQTQQQISIREISEKMDISEENVIEALINSYLEGIIDGNLDARNNFTLKALKLENKSKELTLERWERILLGALVSESVIPWPKIAALLEVDRTDARNRAFEFLSRGISDTSAKDTVLVLENIPNLPPLVQISNLEPIEVQVLGYILSKEEFNINKLSKEFNFSTIETFRFIYYLCGSGLFQVKREKNLIHVTKKSSIEPEKSIKELDLVKQQMIRAIQQMKENSIPLKQLKKDLELNSVQLMYNLYEIIALGYFSGEINSKYFIRKSSLNQIFRSSICLFCGNELGPRVLKCTNCLNDVPQCGVCRGNINSHDDLLACPICKNLSHSNHIRQWLQIKKQCPFCRKTIRQSQLLVRQPLL